MRKSFGRRSSTRLCLLGLIVLGAVGLTGCIQPGDSVYTKTITYDLPKIKNGQQNIARVGCKFYNASVNAPQFLDLRCYVVLSNGMTDLAHDIRTLADAPWIDDEDVEAIVRDQAESRCRSAVASSGHTIADKIPDAFWRSVANAYFSNAQVIADIGSDCGTVATAAWRELNDNTYSTGHKCIAMAGTLHVDSVNHGPHLQSVSVYPLAEGSTSYPGCLKERLHADNWFGVPFWGND